MRLAPSFLAGLSGRSVEQCSLQSWRQMVAGEARARSGWQERKGRDSHSRMRDTSLPPWLKQTENAKDTSAGDGAGGRGCVRTRPSLAGVEEEPWLPRKVKAGQQTARVRNPQMDKQSRHLVRSRHRCNQGGFGTGFDTARISLVISSVQPVWGGCSLRKAAGTRLQIELNLCEAKNNTQLVSGSPNIRKLLAGAQRILDATDN